MPTDHQISILVDVASNGGARLPSERMSDLLDLVAQDYVEAKDADSNLYKLTPAGQHVLDERGVGANES